jgi:hypothetical protein
MGKVSEYALITLAAAADLFYLIQSGVSKRMTIASLAASAAMRIVDAPVPTAKTTSTTLTIAELLTRIITGTHTAGATQTYTLPTGTLTEAGATFAVGSGFEWSLINLSAAAADTITVAAGTDHTVVGNMVVQSAHSTTGALYGSSARFLTKKTATNTFVTYRIA